MGEGLFEAIFMSEFPPKLIDERGKVESATVGPIDLQGHLYGPVRCIYSLRKQGMGRNPADG